MHWQLGEWQELVALAQRVDQSSVPCELAVYFAVACFQMKLPKQAASWVQKAQAGGLDNRVLATYLLGGLYATLGRARHAVANDPSEETQAVQHCDRSARLALGNIATPGIIRARLRNQLEF